MNTGIIFETLNGKQYFFEVIVTGQEFKRAVGMRIVSDEISAESSLMRWRYQVHPFDFGLSGGRSVMPRSYIDANADATNGQFVTAPPRVFQLSLPLASGCSKILEFNGEIFFIGGRYIYRCNSSYTVTLDRDLGSGVTATDAAVFNNELIVACGPSNYIQIRNTSGTWTTSSSVYAEKLAVVNDRLWRSLSNNLFSCSVNPGNAANYIQSNNVGDTTYAINALVEYGGIIWPVKQNGAYQADVAEIFKNQTPQMAQWPNVRNGKGSFVAKGSLFVPTINGLIEVNRGSSRFVGPENANRPVSGLQTYAGIEWQGTIYLVCKDDSSGGAFLIKMIRNDSGSSGMGWIYHQLGYIGSGSAVPASMAVSTIPVNPTVFIGMETGTTVYYIKLGRGGGRDVDDSNYVYQNSYYIKTGKFQPVEDRSADSIFHGVDVISSLGQLDSLSIDVTNDVGEVVTLSTDIENLGETVIRATRPMSRTRMYAPVEFRGRMFDIMIYGESASANAGQQRPEIYEIWAFGYARPSAIEVIEVAIRASDYTNVGGVWTGMSMNDIIKQIMSWKESAELLKVSIPALGYDDPMRCIVTDLQINFISDTYHPHALSSNATLMVELVRLDYGRE